MTSLYAKRNPNQKLQTHLQKVADTTEKVLQKNGETESIQRAGWIAGFFHDMGKANPEWQAKVKENKHPPHSWLSATITTSILDMDSLGLTDSEKFGCILAVLHHHTPWSDSRMNGTPDRIGKSNIENTVESIQNKLTCPKDNLMISDIDIPPEELTQMIQYVRSQETDNSEAMKIGVKIYSALRQSDWHESANVQGESSPLPENINPEEIEEFDSLRPFQKEIKQSSDAESLLGLAGCGEGKTYSALIWGKQQVKNNNASRMVFAMPTQTTTNNLYQKISDHYNKNGVSLYHSSADVLKYGSIDTEDNEEKIQIQNINIEQAEFYQAPFNITTVDHVLDTFVSNYDTSTIAYTNLENAAIVFDEIHAYDRHTAGNILGCIKKCEELDIPYYVMSATIPKQIQNEVPYDKKITSSGSITQNTIDRSPFDITVSSSPLTIEEAEDNIKKNADKIMIVKNTVRDAQRLALELRAETNHDIYYYSSEFCEHDRKEKESEIIEEFKAGKSEETTKILVCTQICEISLDLSADQLLTDIAPIDSIFQRAGRIHRKGTHTNTEKCNCPDCQNKHNFDYEVTVFDKTDNEEPVYPYTDNTQDQMFQLLEKTANILKQFGTYTFKKSIDATCDAYKSFSFDFEDRIYQFSSECCELTDYFEERESRYKTRNITKRKTRVFPSKYITENKEMKDIRELLCDYMGVSSYDKVKNEMDNVWKTRLFYKQFTVPIPAYWMNHDDAHINECGLFSSISSPIMEIDYSYECGAIEPGESIEFE